MQSFQFLARLSLTVLLLICSDLMFAQQTLFAQQTARLDTSEISLGIVKTKPASGRFVKVDGGYMVPYQATIPGTDVKYSMEPIPGGKFTLGSPESEPGRKSDEGPQVQVTIEPFWIGKYEVTWAEYQKFMGLARAFKELQRRGLRKANLKMDVDAVTAPSELYDPDTAYEEGAGANQPAATMTHFSAQQYTKWLSLISDQFYRLPSETEWEYACRAGTKTAYYFGDNPDDLKKHGWFYDNADLERHAVGKLAPNPWGLHDIYGNVAEWVLDAYDQKGYSQLEVEVAKGVKLVYVKSKTNLSRVARGGTFDSNASACRSATRLGSTKKWAEEDLFVPPSPWWYSGSPANGVGFRIVRPFTAPKTLQAKNIFWADNPTSIEHAIMRADDNGRGAFGKVDSKLPEVIKKFYRLQKNRR